MKKAMTSGMRPSHAWRVISVLCLLGPVPSSSFAWAAPQDQEQSDLKVEHFDHDPDWEGYQNNLTDASSSATIVQDFGYSKSHFAGKETGEIGGRVSRAFAPAFYAAKIVPKTLNDKLSASGTYAAASWSGSAMVIFGWFNSKQEAGAGRPSAAFGLNLGFKRSGGNFAVRMVNSTNRSCGVMATPSKKEVGKAASHVIKTDGTRYHWMINYDPQGGPNHTGQFQCSLQSDRDKHDDFEGKVFTVDLPAGFKEEGATFDHFGIINGTKPGGGGVEIYFDDVTYDGKSEDFSKDPGWEGSSNRRRYQQSVQPGQHDFGFSAKTSFAGGSPGEIGGILWRNGRISFAYYADRIGPLTLNDRLEARGKVMLKVGAPDSGIAFGWFNSEAKNAPSSREQDRSPDRVGSFLGVHVEGPTRVGHQFSPTYTTAKGTRVSPSAGPRLVLGKVYNWSLLYDPQADGGNGSITVKVGEETVTLKMRRGHKAEGGSFDRFGLFTKGPGGQMVEIYFDDISYTAGQ
jgi:hypothetical protein